MMQVLAELSIPLPEVSGLCIGTGANGGSRVFAIGDRGDGIASCPLSSDGSLGEWDVLQAQHIKGWDLTQLEAVAPAGPGRVLVVSEEPSILAVIDLAAKSVVGRGHLAVGHDHPLHKAWVKEANSRVEGMLPLVGGGLLAAKEKDPTALVRFGAAGQWLPAGELFEPADELPAAALWMVPDSIGDISELAVAPDGSLALLSDQSRSISLVAWPLPSAPEVEIAAVVTLPKAVSKAEGLVWLSDSVVAVASDTKKPKDNLVLLQWG